MHRILVLAANPNDSSPLRLGKEVHDIQEGLRRSRHRDLFDVVSEWAIGARELRRALLDHQPEFVHFSGHGTEKGITLEDQSGATHHVGTDALAELFSHFARYVRCVLLNACHSQPQAEAISRVIPYAIGMRGMIQDEAAIEFAVGFYDAVGAGREIDEAFAIGCSAIHASGLPSHSDPVLNHHRIQDDAPVPERGQRGRPSLEDHPFSSSEVPALPQPTQLSHAHPVAQARIDPPRVFISYAWEPPPEHDAHKRWVHDLATRLRGDGIDAMLDQWEVALGDQLPKYMERSLRSDFVLVICTPRYREVSDERTGRVGYEGDVITAEILQRRDRRKFIPILRTGTWVEAAPAWLLGSAFVDLSGDPYSDIAYGELLDTLLGSRETAPPVGPPRSSLTPT
jgi:hypothetical protein